MSIATFVGKRSFFYGWWVVFASAVIVFLTGGTFFYGFSALFNPIEDEFGWNRASIAFAFSLRSEVGGIASPAVGYLVDRVGARRLMMGGVVLVAIGFALLSRVDSLVTFYGAVIVIAIGMSATGGPHRDGRDRPLVQAPARQSALLHDRRRRHQRHHGTDRSSCLSHPLAGATPSPSWPSSSSSSASRSP